MSAFDDQDAHWLGGRRPSMRPPARIESRLALAAIAVLVGFLVAVQATGDDAPLSRLSAERPEDLTRILADLGSEADELTRQVAELRVKLTRYRDTARGDDAAVRDARQSLADLEVLAGTVPVTGPGVTIEILDPEGRVVWDSMLDLVQEMRDAGAEAIAIGDVRVIASTWFGPSDRGGVVVDGRRIEPPYALSAIGPGGDLLEALGIPGGPLTVIEAQPGVAVELREAAELSLPASEDASG
ncbi:MAG: DUF881 domain-containing protein [Actinomycetota bacterium]|nr:DUF881 domain-containing protein [Actinomycetota bacterium]